MDFFSFEANPEFVAAFRFMFWSSFFAISMIAYDYYRRAKRGEFNAGERPFPAYVPLGVMLVYISVALHQLYYWLVHRSKAHEQDGLVNILDSVRHITSILLIIMCVGGLFYASLFLRDKFGARWPIVGAGGMIALWCIGYGDARWL